MNDTLPGMTVEIGTFHEDEAQTFLSHVFSCGGIVMSQLCTMTGLEPYLVQNWVKRGFVTKPLKKTYSVGQFCRIVMINLLRSTLSLDEIVGLFSYINGALDDTSDDRIEDEKLYNLFVNMLGRIGGDVGEDSICRAAHGVLPPDLEPTTAHAVEEVLRVMAYAYFSSELKRRAQDLLRALN